MNKIKKNRFLFTTLFALVIFFLSVFPVNLSGGPSLLYFTGMDKLVHAVMYCFFTILALSEFFFREKIKFKPLFVIVTTIFLYSVLVEFIQHFLIASRSGEINDALANLAGILIGSSLVTLIKKVRS
jgi:VanZ family protein